MKASFLTLLFVCVNITMCIVKVLIILKGAMDLKKAKWLVIPLFIFSLLMVSPSKVEAAANSLEEVIEVIKDEFQAIRGGTNKKYGDKDYELIPYEDIMRERNGFSDKPHTFYATVQQYEESEEAGVAFGLVMRDDDIDTAYYVFYPTLPDKRLMKEDRVDLYGSLHGLYSYETVMGATKTVPVLLVHKVLVEGIDY